MSTTTYAPRLATHRTAARTTDRSDGRRLLAGLVALAPSRASSGTVSTTFATTSPFAELAPDGRQPRRVVATMLATLAWVPVLALTLVAFAVVGVAAGVATAAVWCWRSVSPARAPQARPGGNDATQGEVEPSATRATSAVRPGGRRLVRDRTLGYDA